MRKMKSNFCEDMGKDAQQLWGEVVGLDNRNDQEHTFTVYTQNGSFLIVNDKGHERLAGPDRGVNRRDIIREVMVQFEVHALRLKPSLGATVPGG
jgi:hypothetical protein